jgi:L-aspartate semialdehyde sulfurtransferase ferredoxin
MELAVNNGQKGVEFCAELLFFKRFSGETDRKGVSDVYNRTLVLRFSREIVDKPIITNLVRNYNLTFNILKAQIYPQKEGILVMELQGTRQDFDRGVNYLKDVGVHVESVTQGIRRDDEKCYQCGACTAVCPTHALHIRRPQMEVLFESERCSACELCVKACPARAMIVTFDKEQAI